MKSIKVFILISLVTVASVLSSTICNAQFHAGIDIKYSIGVCEENADLYKIDNTNSLGINLSGLYEFTPQIWAGVGMITNINNKGMTIVDDFTVTEMPIMQFAPYITMRYRPFVKHLNAYVFTDLGYAIPFKTEEGIQTFSNGVMWNIGVGYSYMFKKHFGLNFNVGYSLQQIEGTPTHIAEHPISGFDMDIIAQNNLRHSIGIAVGLIF
jgi:hypothetical protein